MSPSSSDNLRPIHINFDAYGGSDDDEFKHELIVLMANSVYELRDAAMQSLDARKAEVFRKAAHKAKSTLVLLQDNDFAEAVEQVRVDMITGEDSGSFVVQEDHIKRFLQLCGTIIQSLENEAHLIRQNIG